MQSLKDKISIRKVKEALTHLPRGSGSAASKIAYDETMNRIRGQEKGFCDLAIATSAWISLAIRPLTLRELQCALSVEPGDTEMDEADFVDEETLSSVCAGLVVVDHESQIVRLAHYTTQEYFESQKDALFLNKQDLLAKTCLTYLSFDVFSNWQRTPVTGYCSRPLVPPAGLGPDERENYSHCYPFLGYAARHWHEHAHSSQDPTVQTLIIAFLKRTKNLAALLCLWGSPLEQRALSMLFPKQSIHGLPIAARYGFTDVVSALPHLEGYCPEDRNSIKAIALCSAACFRQPSVLRVLLDGNTIAPAAVSRALSRMYMLKKAPSDLCEVAEILLDHGADPNVEYVNTPLIHWASWWNDAHFADLLLSHGADVELNDGRGGTLLHGVAERGVSGDIVEVLLEHNIDINARDYEGQTALLSAVRQSRKNFRSLVTQLLGFGVSVDHSDVYGRTALSWAVVHRAVKIACQLLEAGADVNVRICNVHTDVGFLKQSGWDWDSVTEEERAECEEILERYSFHQSGERSSVSDSSDDHVDEREEIR